MVRVSPAVVSRPLDSGQVIDLRSDTQTRPSAGMRDAMARAEVGDEQEREDPTVLELERRVAALLGQEEAVYLPTATMGNQIALSILGERGTELVVEEKAHIMVSELGRRSGFLRAADARRRRVTAAASRPSRCARARMPTEASTRREPRSWRSRTPTTPPAGRSGRSTSSEAVVDAARELEIRIHLDGARLFNAAVALAVAAGGDRRRVRHGEHLPLERARLPARRARSQARPS